MNVLAPIEGAALLERMGWLVSCSDLPMLADRLIRGEVGAYGINGTDAALILSVGLTIDSGARALWIEALGGNVGWTPRKNRALISAVFDDCETLGRNSQCSEIRIEAGTRTGLKHRLFTVFGFEVHSLEHTTVMRKAL